MELRKPVINPAAGRYTLGLTEQLAIFDKYVDEAYEILQDFVIEREDEIRLGARQRLDEFYEDYGDESFHLPEPQAVVGALEEADDLLNNIIFALYARERDGR